ncbi:MAG TPA: hypothetical protein VFV01_16830 [Spirillospora sp.]|nr:hypothetical protein [Spirillospora sp.]
MSAPGQNQQPTEGQPNGEPQGNEPVGQQQAEPDWKAEARKWEARAKENHQKLKEAEPIVSQWKALEEASKTELQRAQEELTRWQTDAQSWRTKAVSSQVEKIAAADFTDPSDALSAIDPGKYLGAGGEIDEQGIRAALAEVLERKPHWRKTDAPATPRVPAPNPAQGSGVDGRAANDPAQQFAALIQQQLNR